MGCWGWVDVVEGFPVSVWVTWEDSVPERGVVCDVFTVEVGDVEVPGLWLMQPVVKMMMAIKTTRKSLFGFTSTTSGVYPPSNLPRKSPYFSTSFSYCASLR